MENFALDSAFVSAVLMLLLYALIFLVSKYLKDLLSPYSMDEQLTEADNVALSTSVAGYFIGVTIVFVGAVDGPHDSILNDVVAVGLYSLTGVVFLNVSRLVNEKLIFYKFSLSDKIIARKNAAAGAVQAASYVASGLIIAGSIHGEGGNPLISLAFYALGQVTLVVFGFIYSKFISYDVHKEIETGNLGAGFGFSGGIVAIGIICMKAVSGAFISWSESLILLGLDALLVFVLMFFVRFYFDKLIIPKSDLNKEIVEDKNVGAGLLEMFVSISFATVLFYTM